MLFSTYLVLILSAIVVHAKSIVDIYESCYSNLVDQKFKFLCDGKYTMELEKKYKDGVVGRNDEYAVFRDSNDTSRYFITYKDSPLLGCKEISLEENLDSFNCRIRDRDIKKRIYYNFVRCLKINFELVHELVDLCADQDIDPTTFVALHYADRKIISGAYWGPLDPIILTFSLLCWIYLNNIYGTAIWS